MTALDFPANPTEGQVFGRWTFNGTAWMLNPSEASLGNGIVAIGFRRARATGFPNVATDVGGGLNVTFDAQPGRTYRTTVIGSVDGDVAGAVPIVQITNEANTQLLGQSFPLPLAGYGLGIHMSLVETGLSGPQTRKVRMFIAVGSGLVNWGASADAPTYIMVEDITPSAGGVGGGGALLFQSIAERDAFFTTPPPVGTRCVVRLCEWVWTGAWMAVPFTQAAEVIVAPEVANGACSWRYPIPYQMFTTGLAQASQHPNAPNVATFPFDPAVYNAAEAFVWGAWGVPWGVPWRFSVLTTGFLDGWAD